MGARSGAPRSRAAIARSVLPYVYESWYTYMSRGIWTNTGMSRGICVHVHTRTATSGREWGGSGAPHSRAAIAHPVLPHFRVNYAYESWYMYV